VNRNSDKGSVTGLSASSRSETRLALSQLRQAVREVDRQITEIRAEERLFQRYQFGSDIHEIKLTALRAERAGLLARLTALQRSSSRGPAARPSASWLLFPAILGALVWQAIFPKRRASRVRGGSTAAAALAAIVPYVP
jgi:hypothetical protein